MATVLEEMGPGGVFGRNLAFAGSMGDSLEVVARSACDILFIDYPHLLRRCQNACTYHSVLVQNMLGLLSDKAQALSERVVWYRPGARSGTSCCAIFTSRLSGTMGRPLCCRFPSAC